MDNLEKLVLRLEDVTSKLERIFPGQFITPSTDGDLEMAKNRAAADHAAAEAPSMVKLFDDSVQEALSELCTTGQKIGGDVEQITNLTKQAMQDLRVFLWNAAGCKKPTDDASMGSLLKPISENIGAIQSFTSARRASPFFSHLSAISEGIPAIGWVTVSPTPAPYIKEMSDAAQFYVNRVLKDFKEKDKIHADWTKAWLRLLSSMQAYVKQHHTTGLIWNSNPGSKAPAVAGPAPQQSSAPKPKEPPGPPPPPPPSYLLQEMKGDQEKSDADSKAALFAEINKGLDVTKGLKKVTDDMKTHKNPALKQTAPIPGDIKKLPGGTDSKAQPASAAVQRPSRIELEGGKKWIVEYVKNNNNVVINATDMKQVVYIYKCSNVVIQINGKINSITIDGCEKTSVVFNDLVSCMDIINSQRIQIQSLGKMPTLAVQKTDGCQIYLSKDSLNAEIVTSKSSEMNILIPNANGEYDEFPVPEQYKTVWDGKKLRTGVVDIA